MWLSVTETGHRCQIYLAAERVGVSVIGQMVSGYISSYDSGPLNTRAWPQVHERTFLSYWTRYWSSSSCYGDDSQICSTLKTTLTWTLCPAAIKYWIPSSLLQLNTDKTAALVVGPICISKAVTPHLGPLTTNTKQSARDLGIVSFTISTSINTLTVHLELVIYKSEILPRSNKCYPETWKYSFLQFSSL